MKKDIHGNSRWCMYGIEIPYIHCRDIIKNSDFDISGYESDKSAWHQWFEYLSARYHCQMFHYRAMHLYELYFSDEKDAIEFKLTYM